MNNHYIHWITVFVFSKEVFELKLSAELGFVKFYEYTDLTCIMEMEVLTKTLQCFYLSEYKMSFEFHEYPKTSIVVWKTKYQIKMTK